MAAWRAAAVAAPAGSGGTMMQLEAPPPGDDEVPAGALRACLESYELVRNTGPGGLLGGPAHYTVYRIAVSRSGKSWHVTRRYSAFVKLRDSIMAAMRSSAARDIPFIPLDLPTARFFGRTDEKVSSFGVHVVSLTPLPVRPTAGQDVAVLSRLPAHPGRAHGKWSGGGAAFGVSRVRGGGARLAGG